MRQVINNRVYDTQKARELFWDSEEETLYSSYAGGFFLVIGDSEIVPIDKDQAMFWAEQNMGERTYENIFVN